MSTAEILGLGAIAGFTIFLGLPIGRMQGDYRFSFILPIRPEMLRKLPAYEQPEPAVHTAVVAAENQH